MLAAVGFLCTSRRAVGQPSIQRDGPAANGARLKLRPGPLGQKGCLQRRIKGQDGKPRAEARETDRRYFCGITDEMMAADRKALCAVDAALLKEQAAELGAAMANGVRVVFGSKDAVEAAKEMFDTVETL